MEYCHFVIIFSRTSNARISSRRREFCHKSVTKVSNPTRH
uniref:Uncharacterized protein n=1 Tax=Arundo donax TaxID=35708 RepID=A0A0A9AVR7_ARUDO